jgi:hypothetical protein
MDKVRVVFTRFLIGDCEDIEIYAAQPIYEWLQTDAGQWSKENAEDLHWLSSFDHPTYGHQISIVGKLTESDATFYNLKWGLGNAPR